MPAYVRNPTWADGSGGATPITAAKLNNMESGIFDAHYPCAVRVYNNANLSINNSTATPLTFNSERFDTESNAASTQHDTSSNTSRLTCRTAGKYQITGHVMWAANATGMREIYVQVNGATIIADVSNINLSAVVLRQNITTLYDLAVNDFVELIVFQDSGGSLNVTSTFNASPEFSMVRVA